MPHWVGLSDYDGGYAEYLLVPHARYLIKLERLAPREAAPLTDAALTPYRAIRKAAAFLEPGHHVLLVGLGGLGQYGFKLLRLLSASPIIVADVSPQKLALANALGADGVVNAREPDALERVEGITRGGGVAAAFDFVGSDETLALAISATRALGKVTRVGLAGGTARLLDPADLPSARSHQRRLRDGEARRRRRARGDHPVGTALASKGEQGVERMSPRTGTLIGAALVADGAAFMIDPERQSHIWSSARAPFWYRGMMTYLGRHVRMSRTIAALELAAGLVMLSRASRA